MEYQAYDKFEYKWYKNIPLNNIENILNSLGENGWEVVNMQIIDNDRQFTNVLLKRKLICIITE